MQIILNSRDFTYYNNFLFSSSNSRNTTVFHKIIPSTPGNQACYSNPEMRYFQLHQNFLEDFKLNVNAADASIDIRF